MPKKAGREQSGQRSQSSLQQRRHSHAGSPSMLIRAERLLDIAGQWWIRGVTPTTATERKGTHAMVATLVTSAPAKVRMASARSFVSIAELCLWSTWRKW